MNFKNFKANVHFLSAGSTVDRNGQRIDWPESVMANFWSRAQCFIDQYNNFTNENATGEKSGGSKTAGENIADTMGLQSVFNAYKALVRESIVGDRKLPGLADLSNEQLFFLSFGTVRKFFFLDECLILS